MFRVRERKSTFPIPSRFRFRFRIQMIYRFRFCDRFIFRLVPVLDLTYYFSHCRYLKFSVVIVCYSSHCKFSGSTLSQYFVDYLYVLAVALNRICYSSLIGPGESSRGNNDLKVRRCRPGGGGRYRWQKNTERRRVWEIFLIFRRLCACRPVATIEPRVGFIAHLTLL